MILSRLGVLRWIYGRVLDWMIGFLGTLYTVLWTTGNYSAIADLLTLYFTVTHALWLSVFTSRILVTDLLQTHCNFSTHQVFFAESNIFLVIILQLPIPKTQLNWISSLQSLYPGRLPSRNSAQFLSRELFFITTLHAPRKKHSLSIVEMCLQRLCITKKVIRLLLAYALPWEFVYRVVA
jgi:hypothetical protein